MGRRADHSKEELYELAIEAARRLVEAEGFRALTARNVADAIGYSPGTLYNHFENLDDLILHLNGRLLDEMHEELAGQTGEPNLQESLYPLLDAYLGFVARRARLWALLFEHSLPEGHAVPDWYQRKIEKVLALLVRALAPAFPPDDTAGPRRAAGILWASLHGIWSLAASGKLDLLTEDSATELARSLFTTYAAGLAGQRAASRA